MKKMSKRVLSLLLSILLVVTSIPMFAFASFAEDGEINEVDITQPITDAMNAYEAKMDGTVYINMANAYNAYVNAQKAKDAVKYGDKTIDIDAVAATLISATNDMQPWTPYTATGTVGGFSKDTSGSTFDKAYASNVLYSPKNTDTNGTDKSERAGYKDVTVQIFQSETVLLYDGKNDAIFPVLSEIQLTANKTRYLYQLYPIDSAAADATGTTSYPAPSANFTLTGTGLGINKSWRGVGGNSNQEQNWFNAMNGTYGAVLGDNTSPNNDNRFKLSTSLSGFSRKYWWSTLANAVKYVGTPNGYSQTYKLYWFRNTGDSAGDTCSIEHPATITVINYKALTDALTNASANFSKVSSYKQGGLATLINGVQEATNLNPNSYFTSGNGSSDCANAISSAVTKLSSSVTADETGYVSLRAEMDKAKNTYKNADSTKYTADSWQTFARAYETARDIFANIQTTGYNNSSDAQAKADALKAAFAALETNDVKADTKELEIVIDNADDAIANPYIFTADSYAAANLEALVEAAKLGVWGGNVENYKVDAEKLSLTDENVAVIENHRLSLVEAINKLVINCDQTVAAANDYSLNSAIAYAATFKNTDYANYDIVTKAVNAANQFKSNPALIDATHENSVLDAVNSYVQIIRDILAATKGLHKAFSLTENGTKINGGTEVSTKVQYDQHDGENKYIVFTRNDDQVFFRTNHDAYTFDLGQATLDFNTSANKDCHFDSINMNDIAPAGEINSESNQNNSGTDVRDYPGALSVRNGGGLFKLDKIFVQSASSDILGHDMDGNDTKDPSFDFTEALDSSSGTFPTKGAVTAKNGTTRATAAYTVSVSAVSARTLSDTTIPTKSVFNPSGNLGMLYWYHYQSGAFHYYGYRHGVSAYSQKATVIDIAYLFDLINMCDAIVPTGYTNASYAEFAEALRLSKSDFDYSSMTPDEILSECQTRYTRLWNAKEALVPAANNTSLKEAVTQTMATFQSGKSNYSTASWNTFAAAFEEARTAYNGKYSDAKVADFGTDEQPAIDALAKALMDAYNALESFANFQPVYDAATAVANAFEAEKYTCASLEAVANQLKDSSVFPYLNMTEEQKKTVYADNQAQIDAEALEIAKLTAQSATIDGSVLEAAIAKVKNDYKDPDAWEGVEEAIAKIRSMTLYAPVEIYNGITVSGVKFANQTELDAEITNLLSTVTLKKYTVTVDGKEYGTFDYGTSIDVPSADGSIVDWYYTYSSNTSNTEGSNETYSGKYLSSTDTLTFVVKGNTTLTTKKATQETVKVTYVNALNGNTIAADYVVKGSTVAELPAAPSLVYYKFDNYTTANGAEFTASTTVDKNVIVYANYSRTESDELYTLYLFNVDSEMSFDEGYYYYNDRIEFNSEDLIKKSKFDRTTPTYKVNGQAVEMTASKRAQDAAPIYAWAIVNKNDIDAFYAMLENGEFDQDCGYLSIIHYGLDYTFYMQDDTYLYALTEQEYKDFTHYQETDIYGQVQEKGNGMIDTSKLDENGAAVAARDAIVRNNDDTKFSMIGTFTLPEGATEVEYGMLFTTTTGSELTLENVGTNGIARMKSSQHTAGNQFVISVKSTSLAGQSVNMQYRAYLTYKAADGTLHTVYSSDVTLTEQF